MNYEAYSVGAAKITKADAGAAKPSDNDSWSQTLAQDQEILWRSNPRQRLGIDFSLKLGSIDIHLGGLLHFVGNLGNTPDNFYDNGISLSLDYSPGGH